MIPFIDLKPLSARIRAKVLPEWEKIYDACEFVGGPRVARLEAELARRLGTQSALACANGTDAILIALQALGVGPGAKVALPNLTFWATYEAPAQLGATPVLIDVDAQTLQLDFEEFAAAWREHRFTAAILVHLMGWATPELKRFRDFCRENRIALVEDGAQAYGVEVDGRSVFAGAQVSTLSFYPAKVLGTCMDGGAILSDDSALLDRMRSLCNHGRSAHYSYAHVGWNSRMSGLSAAFLLELLPLMDEVRTERLRMSALYRSELAHESGLELYSAPARVQGNGYLSVAAFRRGDVTRFCERLKEAGVGTGRVYPETLDVQPPARTAIRTSSLSRSRDFCTRVFNLPLYYGLTEKAQAEVIDVVRKVLA